MTRIAKYLSALLPALFIVFCSVPAAQAQAPSRESQDRLFKIMDAQEELTDDDVKMYLQNAGAIFRLRSEPNRLNETVDLIGWTDKRFAYVTTKMAAGMSLLMTPDDARNSSIPEFARPTSGELRLIQRYQAQLEAAMAGAQRAYAAD